VSPMRAAFAVFAILLAGCGDDIAACGDRSCLYAAEHAAVTPACCTGGCAISDNDCGSGLRYVNHDGTGSSCVDHWSDCLLPGSDMAQPTTRPRPPRDLAPSPAD